MSLSWQTQFMLDCRHMKTSKRIAIRGITYRQHAELTMLKFKLMSNILTVQ